MALKAVQTTSGPVAGVAAISTTLDGKAAVSGGGAGYLYPFKVDAAVAILANTFIGMNTVNGCARPLVSGDPFLGISIADADNSGGAAGDLLVPVLTNGDFTATLAGVTFADCGKRIYATDSTTMTKTQSGTFLGEIAQVFASTVFLLRVRPSVPTPTPEGGRLIKVTAWDVTGTWTKQSLTANVLMESFGSGGGAGAAIGGAAAASAGGGGGGGGYGAYYGSPSDLTMPVTVTVDPGGAGGAAGNHDGVAGGTTSLSTLSIATGDPVIPCSANGGGLGKVMASGVLGTALGGAGGSGSGTYSFMGEPGEPGIVVSGAIAVSGGGGKSARGSGGGNGLVAAANGNNGAAPGGGGGGGLAIGAGDKSGGNGGAGKVLVWEYS